MRRGKNHSRRAGSRESHGRCEKGYKRSIIVYEVPRQCPFVLLIRAVWT
jgi:hypothetical protein